MLAYSQISEYIMSTLSILIPSREVWRRWNMEGVSIGNECVVTSDDELDGDTCIYLCKQGVCNMGI